MDSYLVRIYRRSNDDPENIVGVVEEIDTGQTHAFRSVSDLCRTLMPEKMGQSWQGIRKKSRRKLKHRM